MKPMNPSDMTTAQMGKICDLLTAGLRKSGLQSEPTQTVIENQGNPLVDGLVAVVRRFVEAVSKMITRRVQVDRTRTPQEVLDSTKRKQYTDKDVVTAMPRGDGAETKVVFFNVGSYVSDDELEEQYELRGLKPADPFSLFAVNEADPAFADEKPNATHWKDSNGKWCYATFSRWLGDLRRVVVYRLDGDWNDCWWFAGLRK